MIWWKNAKNKFEADKIGKEEEQLKAINNYLCTVIKDSKNLSFLIGSGCSQPTIPLLSNIFKDILEKFKEDFDLVKESYNFEENKNLEAFLNWLNSAIVFFRNNEERKTFYKNLFDNCKQMILDKIKETFENENIYLENLQLYINFYNILLKIRSLKEISSIPYKNPINIFTTNYDIFNEIAMEKTAIKYTTGFDGDIDRKFSIENFRFRIVDDENRFKEKWDPFNAYIKLFKIHGSINWVQNDNSEDINLSESWSKNYSNVLIYPTLNKNNETLLKPYAELFREFSIQLQKNNTTLVIMGYGFPDEHINQIILQALSSNSFTLIVFADIDGDEDPVKKFFDKTKNYNNVVFIGGKYENNLLINHFENIIKTLEKNIGE
ncbi:SIR2 family protein [Spiroplasma tabanidicola]|uniref:Uncharacterized protein n=1 Tax=Spiroplasma tabanidicola TaxID=324079 RepID=A0A6I6CA46_9MOLU|nr:SIR2 family protein [Spiroplasma tabanidicola]QGS51815.1 hypothetical protein STABA_v1c04520 [Spiroplasma tabanidicola]